MFQNKSIKIKMAFLAFTLSGLFGASTWAAEVKEIKGTVAEKLFKTIAAVKPDVVAGAGDKNSLVITQIMAGYESQFDKHDRFISEKYTASFNTATSENVEVSGKKAKIFYEYLSEYFPESEDGGEDMTYWMSSRIECLRTVDYYTCSLYPEENL